MDAYHQLCPELGPFLQDETDAGQVLAEVLGLTPHAYRDACNWSYSSANPDDEGPQAWLGGMLLKVLKDPRPATANGRPYSPEEIAYYWEQAQRLPLSLKPSLADKLRNRIADGELWQEVRNWVSRRPVLTITGRLWAGASFCSSRNCLFQGPAADGMILGLWELWRCGLKLVSVIHDQVVVEAPVGDKVLDLKEAIEALMIKGMLEVIPGMNVRMESFVTKSLDKTELDPRFVASENTPV